jgi:hypothetical protein
MLSACTLHTHRSKQAEPLLHPCSPPRAHALCVGRWQADLSGGCPPPSTPAQLRLCGPLSAAAVMHAGICRCGHRRCTEVGILIIIIWCHAHGHHACAHLPSFTRCRTAHHERMGASSTRARLGGTAAATVAWRAHGAPVDDGVQGRGGAGRRACCCGLGRRAGG